MDERQHSPACERNREPIAAELQRVLPEQGLMLEIASGTGQHAAHFAAALPGWRWQPSDRDETGFASIRAWCCDLSNVSAPVLLDVRVDHWAAAPPQVDAVFCANMIHIAPWPCTAALMQGAARLLAPQGLLVTYGPYLEDGVATSPGNLAFDADLKARNADWGLRHLNDVAAQAAAVGLALRERVDMPANNLLLVWGRSEPA
jgi:SAM-dependent methyltransferase